MRCLVNAYPRDLRRELMEKKEARIKCSGCGAPYKLKIPVTEKPVSFKCKKCGKVLKLKVKQSSEQEPLSASEAGSKPEFEMTQLPDADYYQDRPGPPPGTASFVEGHEFVQAPTARSVQEPGRQWMILADELIKGPFTGTEVIDMIKTTEVAPDTSVRMGERPWLKVSEIPDFKAYFPVPPGKGAAVLDTISLLEGEEAAPTGQPTALFFKQRRAVFTYPVASPTALAIFAAAVFLGSTVLSLDLLIGLPLNLLLWILLYGYLAEMMSTSMLSSKEPPPAWNIANMKQMALDGLGIFVVFLVYTIIPVMLLLLGAVYCFRNGEDTIGYALIGATVLAFAGTLLLIPACLINLCLSGSMGAALSPGRALFVIKTGRRPYLMLAAVSIVIGLVCMAVTYGGFFLSIAVDFGFVVSGLLMAAVLSYAHFLWFHLLGLFAGENRKMLGRA